MFKNVHFLVFFIVCFICVESKITVDASIEDFHFPKIELNHSIDPCEDLYEHVCSRWKRDHPVPPDRTAYSKLTDAAERIKPVLSELYSKPESSNSKAINELKQYFRSCIDMDAINEIKSREFRAEVRKIGEWPLLIGSSWNSSGFDLTQLLIDISRPRGYRVFVDFSSAQDLRNVSRWLLNFDQRQMVMETKEYYLNDKYKSKLDTYRDYMRDILWTMIEEELENVVEEHIKFDKQLAKLSKSKEDRYDFDRLYNLRHLSDMNKLAPVINWTRYLIDISPPALHPYYKSDPEIVINEMEYMREISNLLAKTDSRIIINYAFWRLTHVSILTLDSRYQAIQDTFNRRLLGKEKRQLRWKECLIETTENMDQASGAVYVRAKFKQEDFEVAKTMVEELRESFIRTFKSNHWVSPKIKEYALKKATAMLQIVGGPDLLFNDTLLDEYYSELTLNKNDSFIKQEQKVLQFEHHRRLLNLLEPPGRNTMEISAALVNAYNEQTNNKIIIPAAILQEPFFHRNYPKLSIYAGVGAIIGHEMGHSFDGQGRQFDMRGNLFNWWDNKTLLVFNSRAKCIADQYAKYPVKGVDSNLHINGQLTRDENLADLVGLKHAYLAYHSHLDKKEHKEIEWPGLGNYTSEQMFFLSYANILCTSMTKGQSEASALTDPHSPANWRINGVVSNMPEFSKAFKCRPKATLNLKKKCEVW